MKRPCIYIIITIIISLTRNSVKAQTSIQLEDVVVNHQFGREISFTARVEQPDRIKDIFLFFKVEGEKEPRGSLVVANLGGFLNLSYDVQQDPIRPFADISYWYTLNLKSGETFISQEYYFKYTDNRFPWQTLKSDSVQVNWYSGGTEFGKDAFDILHKSILRTSNFISISIEDPIQLYLYASQAELQDSLSLSGMTTLGPELQVLLFSIPPASENNSQMEESLSHELAHLLLYRKTGVTYTLLPVWLREGIATQAEINPNPNYDFTLANTVENQTLIPLSNLCTSFPQDDASNFLAYSQANSFTSYLFDKYGLEGLEKLIQIYAGGMDCEQGSNSALGKTLSQLEFDWLQATFNKNAFWHAVTNFLPYLVILFLILMIPLLNQPKTPSHKEYEELNETENS